MHGRRLRVVSELLGLDDRQRDALLVLARRDGGTSANNEEEKGEEEEEKKVCGFPTQGGGDGGEQRASVSTQLPRFRRIEEFSHGASAGRLQSGVA